MIILFRGLPGAGKSTLSQALCEVTFAADDYFIQPDGSYRYNPLYAKDAHQQCIRNVEVAIRLGIKRIGVANTFTQQWEIERYYQLAEKYSIPIFSVIVETRHNSTNDHAVPADVLQVMAKRFEVQLIGAKS